MDTHSPDEPRVTARISRRQAIQRAGGMLAAVAVVPEALAQSEKTEAVPTASRSTFDPEGLKNLTPGPVNTLPSKQSRCMHTVTPLTESKLLIVGGERIGPLSSAIIFEASTNDWTPVASMKTARKQHAAVRLPDGKVLVVGGASQSPLSSAEIYDPETNRWSPAASMKTPRCQHTATLMPNGHVMVMGGSNTGPLAGIEVYDPEADRWYTPESSPMMSA
ncbi:MAG: hypothetical protein KY468_04970 [Armatimonadetes bacterium]|nr:hypothetical protein [Armatimonadota bacterium]